MPFRTKKLSLARSGVSGSTFGLQSRLSKVPNSNQKAPSAGGLHSRNGTHFISAQKTEDAPKLKLFGDRRTSTNVGPTLKGLGNENVSLRIQSGLRSGQKSNIGVGNYTLANQKSQKSFGNCGLKQPTASTLMSGGGSRGGVGAPEYKSTLLATVAGQSHTSASHLKLNSAR